MKFSILYLITLFSTCLFAQSFVRSSHFQIEKSGLFRPEIKDTSFTFLWFGEGDFASDMIIDTILAKGLHPAIKACIAYSAYDLCTECNGWKDDNSQGNRTIDCLLTDALNLGPQCSDYHLQFLNSWFRTDSVALFKINDYCPNTPNSASSQLKPTAMKVLISGTKVRVRSELSGLSFREGKTWNYRRTDVFKISDSGVEFLRRKRTAPIYHLFDPKG